MAFLPGRSTAVYFNDVVLTSYLSSASLSGTGDTADTTTFGNTWKTAIAGQLSATASFSGFYDPALVELDDTLGNASGVLTYCPGAGTAIGDQARLVSVISTTVTTSAPVGGVVAITWDTMADAAVGYGQVLHPHGEDTNTTTGASKDDAAATATGWMAHVHCTLVDGGSWVIKLQDSADNSNWLDVSGGAFTALTTAGSERITSAADAALRRYVRYVATRTGGSVGNGITFGLYYARNI